MSADLKIGNIYKTETEQLRQIIGIATDHKGIVRISYNSKSANFPNKDFVLGHTKAMPPSDEKFKISCGNLLSDDEIKELVGSGIIQSYELNIHQG